MTLAYGAVAGPLALFHLYSGALKAVRSRARLQPMMAWVETTPMPAVRALGAVEVLGALGLVLPPLAGIAPGLALAAVLGFVALRTGATGVHLRRGDRAIGLDIPLLLSAAPTVGLATIWV
ncbi:DoxX family protein [Streptomyces sp. SID625]|nr:DoxX family protein [Streptomyces sp. SID625]